MCNFVCHLKNIEKILRKCDKYAWITHFHLHLGGTVVTVAGAGFSDKSTVTIGGSTCRIEDKTLIEYDKVVCITPKGVSSISYIRWPQVSRGVHCLPNCPDYIPWTLGQCPQTPR